VGGKPAFAISVFASALLSYAPRVFAQSEAIEASEAKRSEAQSPSLPEGIEILPRPPEPRASTPTSPDEAPPPRPRRRGLLLESALGVLAFAGQFRHVAPPAYLIRTTLGFEVLRWLTALAESELAFTDTTETQDPSNARAFPIWGFGGGLRVSAPFGSRLAGLVEGDVGALAAAVPRNTLVNLGFRSAESPGAYLGGRVGVDWYQVDPHLALVIRSGARAALGFSASQGTAGAGTGDVPLMWDIAVGLRYVF
jgi:hypothetical protein